MNKFLIILLLPILLLAQDSWVGIEFQFDGYDEKDISEMAKNKPQIRSDYYKYVEEGIIGGTKNLEEFLGRKKKKDGGIMELTIMQIPDIEVKGVESLFKAR